MYKRIILLISIIIISIISLVGCSKNEILEQYNKIISVVGDRTLSKDNIIIGERIFGVDHYTGEYIANYNSFSDIEYLFGGTTIKRDKGEELKIKCSLKIIEGSAKVFWESGSEEIKTLIDKTGELEKIITLPDGGNYFGIEGEDFIGEIKIILE